MPTCHPSLCEQIANWSTWLSRYVSMCSANDVYSDQEALNALKEGPVMVSLCNPYIIYKKITPLNVLVELSQIRKNTGDPVQITLLPVTYGLQSIKGKKE